MSDNTRLDDLMVEMTDQMLKGQDFEIPVELETEARLIRQLHRVIAPDDSVDNAFRSRLTHRLNDEWDQVHRKRSQKSIIPFKLLSMPGLAAAAIFAVVIVGLITGYFGDNVDPGSGQGTAYGDPALFIGLIVVGLAIALGLYLFNRRR